MLNRLGVASPTVFKMLNWHGSTAPETL